MVFTARWNKEILSIGWRFPPVRGTSSCQEEHVSIFAQEFRKPDLKPLEFRNIENNVFKMSTLL